MQKKETVPDNFFFSNINLRVFFFYTGFFLFNSKKNKMASRAFTTAVRSLARSTATRSIRPMSVLATRRVAIKSAAVSIPIVSVCLISYMCCSIDHYSSSWIKDT